MKTHIKMVGAMVLTFCLLMSAARADDKLTADEIIAKHLDSIGTKARRAEIQNRVITGQSQFSILHNAAGSTSGKCAFVSEAERVFFGASFSSQNYPFEKISLDRGQVNAGFIGPGVRSAFGNFILAHREIFSSGLFTGSLSASWSLLDLRSHKSKVNAAGKRKIDGREAYALDYTPNGNSGLSIKLYFDAQTFRHIRTEYSQTISAAQGAKPDDSSRQIESRHQLIEDFSDFSDEGGLTLPHSYRIKLSFSGQNGTSECEWKFVFSEFMFNQKLDPHSYEIN